LISAQANSERFGPLGLDAVDPANDRYRPICARSGCLVVGIRDSGRSFAIDLTGLGGPIFDLSRFGKDKSSRQDATWQHLIHRT
jgi:hypothetical protein